MPPFDVVGVGLNATDTLILVPHMPPYSSKAPFTDEIISPGGQVASALAACSRLGLRTKYIGAVGDDGHGRVQRQSLLDAGIDIEDLHVRPGCASQCAYVIIDGETGERTIFWRRDDRLAIQPAEIPPELITCARLLHIDGHDTAAVAYAAGIARAHGIPVTVDVDTVYPGFDRVLPNVDYLLASLEFPARWTGERDPFRALEILQREYCLKVAAMTLGVNGSLALAEGRFTYSPGYVVDSVDTTGAGDVFHGAFCYAVLQGMTLGRSLDFSNAMAALNCTAMGARGGIRGLDEILAFMKSAGRRSDPEFARHVAAW
jgi:sulfofructose kinase